MIFLEEGGGGGCNGKKKTFYGNRELEECLKLKRQMIKIK